MENFEEPKKIQTSLSESRGLLKKLEAMESNRVYAEVTSTVVITGASLVVGLAAFHVIDWGLAITIVPVLTVGGFILFDYLMSKNVE